MLSKGFDQGRGLNLPATRWYRSLPAAGLHRPEALGSARYWLQVPGSFTRALKQQCQFDFQVDVCREGFGRPSREEANTLNLANRQLAWIREVRLVGDGRPWVLARTVIPLDCLQGRGRALRHLGNKPLGAFLFSSRQWQRSELETGITLQPDHGQPRLARRSLFYRQHHRLMVCEYLLPELYR